MNYFVSWPFGANKSGEKVWLFAFLGSNNLVGALSLLKLEDLTAEEIGQLMGGN